MSNIIRKVVLVAFELTVLELTMRLCFVPEVVPLEVFAS